MNYTAKAASVLLSGIAFSLCLGANCLLPAGADTASEPVAAAPGTAASEQIGPSDEVQPSQASIPEAKPTNSAAAAGAPTAVKFKESAPAVPTVSYGTPSWALKPRLAQAAPVAPASLSPGATLLPVAGNGQIELEKRLPEEKTLVNIRLVKHYHLPPVDTVMAYPWPVRPPQPIVHSKLPEKPHDLKAMILATGYSSRIDFNRPHPLYGWRWVHCFQTAHQKSGLGYPHTFLTMYPWVAKMAPYVAAETTKVNVLEESRLNAYTKVQDEYTRLHEELENEAAAKGLSPIEIKVTRHGIGQGQLPPGNWWISATRKLPDLKFYWQVPITVSAGQTVNVQLTNVNAIVVQGGW